MTIEKVGAVMAALLVSWLTAAQAQEQPDPSVTKIRSVPANHVDGPHASEAASISGPAGSQNPASVGPSTMTVIEATVLPSQVSKNLAVSGEPEGPAPSLVNVIRKEASAPAPAQATGAVKPDDSGVVAPPSPAQVEIIRDRVASAPISSKTARLSEAKRAAPPEPARVAAISAETNYQPAATQTAKIVASGASVIDEPLFPTQIEQIESPPPRER